MTSPTLAAVPSTPATSGREASDQASEASATPVGHMPPTPIPDKKRRSKSCSGLTTKYPTPENSEKHRILAAIARARPRRSPSQPKISPPLATPNRNAALNHENQRGTIARNASA